MAVTLYKVVWLIDDDGLSNYLNTSLLGIMSFAQSIVTLTTVQEALDSLALAVQGKMDMPDIIFLDMEMPGLNGWDFLETFRMHPESVKKECRIFMLSSSINEADALKAKQYKDMCDFIVKPLSQEVVKSIKASADSIEPDNLDV